MADIAIIFHWPPSDLLEMELEDLLTWHSFAIARWNQIHEAPE
ncbi:GpE family phage tail protein [Altererythrobacter endophyticus]|uniref:GpE family phage tail protein n=1 Tax=Altericroceibacterium endophyticum TaxID=1808508 RepID=A0A6I4T8C3_9SPHN|nr:GpE family phage tail protein [Altericroceibacterium endophyticum]